MKKILFGAAALFLMTNCSGNGTTEKTSEDSIRIADSIAQVEAAQAAAEQARQDSIRQDSIAKAEVAAKYDDLVNEYVSNANIFYKKARTCRTNSQYASTVEVLRKCQKLESKINKIKSDLTSEQLSKLKSAKSKIKNSLGYIAD